MQTEYLLLLQLQIESTQLAKLQVAFIKQWQETQYICHEVSAERKRLLKMHLQNKTQTFFLALFDSVSQWAMLSLNL